MIRNLNSRAAGGKQGAVVEVGAGEGDVGAVGGVEKEVS